MENNNNELRKEDIRQITLKIQRRYNYPQDIADIIEGDLLSGVSEEALGLYVGKKLDKRKIVVMSQCLRNGYDSEVIKTICNESFSSHLMETAYKAFLKFNDLEKVKQTLECSENVPDRVKAAINKYEESLPKENNKKMGQSVENNMDSFINEKDKDEEVRQQLVNQLAEKEAELSSKQDELAEALSQVKSLNRINEKKDNELRLLKETVADLQKQVRRKGDALEEANAIINKFKESGISKAAEKLATNNDNIKSEQEVKEVQKVDNVNSVYYTVPVMGYNGIAVAGITINRNEKKSSGLSAIFSKLCFKKKSRVNIVKLVSAGKLSAEQLVMIKSAIEKKLTEGQLVELINNNLDPVTMKEIIEIAVLENSLPD